MWPLGADGFVTAEAGLESDGFLTYCQVHLHFAV